MDQDTNISPLNHDERKQMDRGMSERHLNQVFSQITKSSMRFFTCILCYLLVLACSAQDPFITVWNTANPGHSNSTSIVIPAHSSHNYNYDIDWDNDGRYDTLGVTGSIRHDFGTVGIYEVAIRGTFPRIFFFNSDDPEKIIDVKQWGDIAWENFQRAFEDCSNLTVTAKDEPDLSNGASMSLSQMFKNATNLTGDFSDWDVSNVRFMTGTFQGTHQFNNDISSWDISNCNSIANLFLDATGFNQDISDWETGHVTNFENMFSGASSFDQDLGDWNLTSAINLNGIFDNSGLSTATYDKILRGWSEKSTSLPSNLTVGSLNVSYCNALYSRQDLVDDKGWNIIGDILDCSTEALITKWRTDNPGTSNATSIIIPTSGIGYQYDIDWDNDGTYDEFGVIGLATHNYNTPGTYEVAIRGEFPYMAFNNNISDREKIIDILQWGGIEWESMRNSYRSCCNLIITANDAPNLSNCTSLESTFSGATSLNHSINHWDVSTITTMFGLFQNATAFNKPLDNWDVSNVIVMSGMFAGATSFNQFLNTWETSSLEFSNVMFSGATSYNLSLGNWDVSNLISATGMFDNCGMTMNYDLTLLGWSGQDVQSNVEVGAANLTYCIGYNSRKNLIDNYNWTFTGDELDNYNCIPECGNIENEALRNSDWYSSTRTWSDMIVPNVCHNIIIPSGLSINLLHQTNDTIFNKGFGSTLSIEKGATFEVQLGAELLIEQFIGTDPNGQ